MIKCSIRLVKWRDGLLAQSLLQMNNARSKAITLEWPRPLEETSTTHYGKHNDLVPLSVVSLGSISNVMKKH